MATISDLMVNTMIRWGVKSVFGMVGHSNLGLADAIRRRCTSGNLNFIGIRHEGAAFSAASAYAKLTGEPAAIGAWAAAPDRPTVAITGDGGFGQYMAKLTTAMKYEIPIKHILLNNM